MYWLIAYMGTLPDEVVSLPNDQIITLFLNSMQDLKRGSVICV